VLVAYDTPCPVLGQFFKVRFMIFSINMAFLRKRILWKLISSDY
jgi:hypothetical protein